MRKFLDTRFGWGLIAIFPKAFITIGVCVVQILTLGYYSPSWDFWYIIKISLWKLKLRKNERD